MQTYELGSDRFFGEIENLNILNIKLPSLITFELLTIKI